MNQRPSAPHLPFTSDTADSSRPPEPGNAARGFSLYNLPITETAASLGARRALMSRKSLSVEEAGARARERRREASRIQRFDRLGKLLALLLPAAGSVAWLGSTHDSIPLLLAGYILSGLAAAGLIARLTRMPAAARAPLEHYYLPNEQLASAEDIALLRRLAQQDGELDAVTTTWWRSSAPIRKGDVALAVEFHAAKRGGSGRQET
ncbi:hypothetical protein [Pseudoxanthomonas sp. PXM01]|uniref:hypothetical protein n=1 Tax=Pseudoxanthomonas sp. PXM01 TaxID=2769295 RepID=UPI00177F1FB8|nr:hypothetical protein [Pseudoxanthomonas sp. PXM01]MBD9471209.1 hypothetical protein [Pseudoxanthomonas sp. PXM01]